MATKLIRPVHRETGYVYRGRPIMLLLEGGGRLIRLREKGRRRWFTVTVQDVFWLAVRTEHEAEKARRREDRKQRKRGRP